MKPIILKLPGNEPLAAALVDTLNAELGTMTVRRFPDGESYVRIETSVAGRDVVLACTLNDPDPKIAPLLFAAITAKELRASRVGLVAPYLAYMRQDRRFHPGECVTSEHFAALVSKHVDWLVTVDPHLHRRSSLDEIYSVRSAVVHAAPALAQWIKANVQSPILIGPDSESEQWVSEVARGAGAPFMVLEKIRRGDRDVTVSVPNTAPLHGHTPVLVDDIVSTARTMAAAARHLTGQGITAPVCVGVHAVFSDGAYAELVSAGANRIVTTNTISHPTNAINVTGLVSSAVQSLIEYGSGRNH